MNPIIQTGKEIKSTFPNIDKLTDQNTYGNPIDLNGFRWKLLIRTHTLNNIKYFSPFLDLNPLNDRSNWLIEVNATFSLFKKDGTTYQSSFNPTSCYTASSKGWGFSTFIEWKTFYTTDYIIDNSATLSVKFDYKLYDFESNSQVYRDYYVTVERACFYTNRALLGMWSKTLHDKMSSNYSRSGLQQLDNITRAEFAQLLAAIHPDPIQITSRNFATLMDLAARFEVEPLLKKCMEAGINSTTIPLIDKVKGAEKLRSDDKLMQACIDSLKTAQEFKDFADKPEFKTLKDSTKVQFLTASLNLI